MKLQIFRMDEAALGHAHEEDRDFSKKVNAWFAKNTGVNLIKIEVVQNGPRNETVVLIFYND